MKLEKKKSYLVRAITDTLSYHKGFVCYITLVDYNYSWCDEPKIQERVLVTINKTPIKYDWEFIFYIEPNEIDNYFEFI